MTLVKITMTALVDDDSPLLTKQNISGTMNFNLAVGACTQVCDLLAIKPEDHPSGPEVYEALLRIKKLERSLCQDLVGSMQIDLGET